MTITDKIFSILNAWRIDQKGSKLRASKADMMLTIGVNINAFKRCVLVNCQKKISAILKTMQTFNRSAGDSFKIIQLERLIKI